MTVEFNHIDVSGGSAGCVCIARLAERPDTHSGAVTMMIEREVGVALRRVERTAA
ncbi:hypothetical protein [uncultured Tateyamaria sp.]|uniref:hypothetical protein n=1 Tax=uncultured Tateyamaria sp. TaxID=455651 RepID=UPI002626EF38|nr:hypothetical protein [uncultured Tateyamaria sp.]